MKATANGRRVRTGSSSTRKQALIELRAATGSVVESLERRTHFSVHQSGLTAVFIGPSGILLGQTGTYTCTVDTSSGQGATFDIDWGDGTTETVTGTPSGPGPTSGFTKSVATTQHKYPAKGTYQIECDASDPGDSSTNSIEWDYSTQVNVSSSPVLGIGANNICVDCTCTQDSPVKENGDASAAGSNGSAQPSVASGHPVSYFTGEPIVNEQDLTSTGFGFTWGVTRSYGQLAASQQDGTNWMQMQLPYFLAAPPRLRYAVDLGSGVSYAGGDVPASGNSAGVAISGRGGMAFEVSTNPSTDAKSWLPYQLDKLTYHPSDTSATLIDTNGDTVYFTLLGDHLVFDHYTDASGAGIAVVRDPSKPSKWTGAGYPYRLERSSGSTVERWEYDYVQGGTATANAGMLQDVKQLWSTDSGSTFTTLREADYAYYSDPSTQPGSLHDLKSVTIRDGAGHVLDKKVYRYYTSNTGSVSFNYTNGNAGDLKFVFEGDAVARAAAAGVDLTSASDSAVAPYADNYFEYDSSHRVTEEIAQGAGCSCTSSAQGTYTYSYATNPDVSSMSNLQPTTWTNETIETLPDGSVNHVFMNAIGQTLLFVHSGGDVPTKAWFYSYNDHSQLSLAAQPSAVKMPSDWESAVTSHDDLFNDVGTSSNPDFQYLSNTRGAVYRYDYWTADDAITIGGAAAGYYHSTTLEHGEHGSTSVGLEGVWYSGATLGGYTVYYRNQEVTPSGQTFHSYDNFAKYFPKTETTTFPTISVSHNGQGTGVTLAQIDTYDDNGNLTQSIDADGYTTKYAYDIPSGGLTKYERDADSGGLDLTTNYIVDPFGRPTKMTDAKGNVTYYTYDDVNRESRTYPGWHEIGTSGLYTTTGPAIISQTVRPAAGSGDPLYTQTVSVSIAPQSTSPTSGATISALQGLSRQITNDGGQVIEQRDYFSLSGTSYASLSLGTMSNDSSSGNYHSTLYHYDDRGRRDGIESPTGSIQRMLYDSLGRLTQVNIGTDDTGHNTGTFDWDAGNLVTVTQYTYDASLDSTESAPSAPSLSQTSGTATAGGTTLYVTISYVGPHGESVASSASSYTITGSSGKLVVAHPTAAGGATGYNVYVSTTSTEETRQNGDTPVPIGSDWTEDAAGFVVGELPLSPDTLLMTDGNLSTMTRRPAPGDSTKDQVTAYYYDWRDRLVLTKAGVSSFETDGANRLISYTQYDDSDNVVQVDTYAGDGVTVTATDEVPDAPATGNRRASVSFAYDEWNRVYEKDTYNVAQSSTTNAGNLASSGVLSAFYWYDNRGDTIKTVQPGGLVSKYVYDGAGRVIRQYVSDGGGDPAAGTTGNWAAAGNVAGDHVLQQTETTYDNNDNPVLVTTRLRFHNDTSTNTGDLQGPSSPATNFARVYYQANYYDAGDRLIATADYGTNGGNGTTGINLSTVPSSGATVHVTSYGYSADGVQTVTINGAPTGGTFTLSFGGQTTSALAYNANATAVQAALQGLSTIGSSNVTVTGGNWNGSNGATFVLHFTGSLGEQTVSPVTVSGSGLTGGTSPTAAAMVVSPGGDDGSVSKVTDPLGHVTKTDYDRLGRAFDAIAAFTDGTPTDSTNQTTRYSYDGDDHVLTLTAVLPSDTFQTTRYIYGTTTGDGSALNSNDLLARIEYPDKSTGDPSISASDQVAYTYFATGDLQTATDQNGTTHTYGYDVLGRPISDAITVASGNPHNIDTTVTEHDTAFNDAGLAYLFTSKNGSTVRNQVKRVFNGLGDMVSEVTDYTGAISSFLTIKAEVDYTYDFSNNHDRLTSMAVYQTAYTTTYTYGSGLDDAISRVTSIGDGTNTLAAYSYLGLGTIVVESHPQVSTDLTYVSTDSAATGNPANTGGDQYTGLDQFGRVVDQNWVDTSTGSSYARLQYAYDEGGNVLYEDDLVTPSLSKLYTYDALNRLATAARGTLNSGRTTISSASTLSDSTQSWALDGQGNWTSVTNDAGGTPQTRSVNGENQYTGISGKTTPAYDDDGNTTTDENGQQYVYDAWNHLVTVKDSGGTTLQTYTNDATGRRLTESSHRLAYGGQGDGQLLYDFGNNYTYFWGLGYVNDLIARKDFGSIGAQPVYALRDANHDVTALVNLDSQQTYGRDGLPRTMHITFTDENGHVFTGDATGDNGTRSGTVSYTDPGTMVTTTYDVSVSIDSLGASYTIYTDSGTYQGGMTYSSGTSTLSWTSYYGTDFAVATAPAPVTGVAERFAYDAYGNVTTLDASGSTVSDSYNWQVLYQGGRRDASSHLYHFGARDYSVTLGRWMQKDPAGFIDELNLYDFAGGNPAVLEDPSGLFKVKWDPGSNWTPVEKDRISASRKRIQERAGDLAAQIHTLIHNLQARKSACPCLSKAIDELDKLHTLMLDEYLTASYPDYQTVVFRKTSLAGKPGTPFQHIEYKLFDNEIQFNTTATTPWTALSDEILDRALAHEILHQYGTEDDDSAGVLMNAHTMDQLFTTEMSNRDVSRWFPIKQLIADAEAACAKKK